MSKSKKNENVDEIYEDDFEKFNEDIEEDIDDDEVFLKTLGFITENDEKIINDVSQ